VTGYGKSGKSVDRGRSRIINKKIGEYVNRPWQSELAEVGR